MKKNYEKGCGLLAWESGHINIQGEHKKNDLMRKNRYNMRWFCYALH